MVSTLALLLLVLVLQVSQSFVLQLESTEERCLFDILKENVLFSGQFAVSGYAEKPEDWKSGIKVTVMDPLQEVLFLAEHAKHGKFSFISKFSGKHAICVVNTNLLDMEVNLVLKSGVEAKDFSEVIQEQQLLPLESELLRLSQVAEEVRLELKYLFDTETDMREVNVQMNFRVKYTALFTLFLIVSVGFWQYFHVKAYLASKKVG